MSGPETKLVKRFWLPEFSEWGVDKAYAIIYTRDENEALITVEWGPDYQNRSNRYRKHITDKMEQLLGGEYITHDLYVSVSQFEITDPDAIAELMLKI